MFSFISTMLLLQVTAQYPSYNGGANDGGGGYSLAAPTTFSMFKGGANDGSGSFKLLPAQAFNIYRGGSSDGFAWHNGYSPLAINMYTGGRSDGAANSNLTAGSLATCMRVVLTMGKVHRH